jgi:hypothetical protein
MAQADETAVLPPEAPRPLTDEERRRVQSMQDRKDRFLYVEAAEAGLAVRPGQSAEEVQSAIAELLESAIDGDEKELVGVAR